MNQTEKATRLGWLVCALGALFYCYEYLLRIQPSVMVGNLQDYFQVSAAGLGVLAAMYYLAYTPMQLFVGGLIDYFGPRKTLTCAVTLCAVGVTIFGCSHNLYVGASGRFLVGFGSAFGFVGVLKLAAVWLPIRHFAFFVGLTTALGMVGAMVGNVAMSAWVSEWGWQKIIYLSAVVGVIMAPMIWSIVRDHATAQHQSAAKDLTWKQLVRGFVDVVKNTQIWLGGMVGCMLFMSLAVFAEMWGVEYVAHLYPEISHETAAFANSMVFAGWLLGAPLAGWFSNAIRSRKKPMILGCILSLLCFLAILYIPLSFEVMEVALFCFGLFSAMQICCFVIGRENAPPKMAGTAVAFVNMCVMLSGMVVQPMAGKLMDLHANRLSTLLLDGPARYTAGDFQYGLSLITFGLVIALVLCLFIKESYGKDSAEG